jgi:predicted nucleic acid-binding protein
MLVVDTGVIFAVADRDDRDHRVCDELLASLPASDLLVPTPVIVEASWLIESRLGPNAEAAFLRSLNDRELIRVDLEDADWVRAVELVERYADLSLGVVDASVVAVAERFKISTIATLNHRDFRVVRPQHTDAFELLPAI